MALFKEMQNFFKLEKLKILVYEDEDRSKPAKSTFQVMFNPESYAVSYRNEFSDDQAIGSSGSEARSSKSKNAFISFKFIFDGTGVSDFGAVDLLKGKKDVYTEVQKFVRQTITVNGNIHVPNFLRIVWGDLNFVCRLEDLQISYTLFDRSGKPLRAELDTTFIGDLQISQRLKDISFSSPDLTHKRIVKSHDTLPLMCEEIYGSGSYYLQVAKANHLDDFRNLRPGQELFFPPIEK